MTITFPDVSQYTPNVDVSAYPICIARATLSDRVADTSYNTFRQRAAAAGTLFLAYHWLNHGNLQAQAAWCYQHVGTGVPVMIDAEDKAGNTGYNGPLTVADLAGFAAAYRALGGTVSLCYLPFWYWSGAMGAPRQLDQLTGAGLHLVSSNYPKGGYTDAGPGWAPYYPGAPAPVQWQYTSSPYDMNAYRGTVDEYARMVGAVDMTPEEHQMLVDTYGWARAACTGRDTAGKVYTDPYDGTPVNGVRMLGDIAAKLDANAAADEARDKAMLAAIQALSAGGTSIDTSAVLAAVKAAGDAESAAVQQLQTTVADLRTQLAAYQAREADAAQAEADALKAQA